MNKYHVKFTHQYIRPQGSTVDTSSAIQYITETVDAEWELNDWVNVFTYIYAHYEVIGCVEVTHINAIKELENDENGGIKMTKGIRKMEAMGFTVLEINQDKFDRGLVRQFIRRDHKDRVTDIINFYYSKSVGVEVYANSLKYGCGSRLDTELLNVIQLNCEELKELENE